MERAYRRLNAQQTASCTISQRHRDFRWPNGSRFSQPILSRCCDAKLISVVLCRGEGSPLDCLFGSKPRLIEETLPKRERLLRGWWWKAGRRKLPSRKRPPPALCHHDSICESNRRESARPCASR